MSIVSQEAVLFNMSFRDNIRLGDVNATDAEVEEAAKAGISFKIFLIRILGFLQEIRIMIFFSFLLIISSQHSRFYCGH